jgi:monoamine oxidase
MSLNRREFMRLLGIAGTAGMTINSRVFSEETFEYRLQQPIPQVLIIGAGAAGLTAGYILHNKGVSFEILEAADTYGGRLKKTEALADFPIDLGAEWLHTWIGADAPALTPALANTHPDFKTFKYQPQTVSHWSRGQLKTRNWLSHLMPRKDRKFISSTWFDYFENEITPAILEHIQLNEIVTRIDRTGARVHVTTHSGQHYEADKVIVTVPVRILQDGDIDFVPPLPAEAICELNKENMTPGLKVFIEFQERFYPDLIIVGKFLKALLTEDHLFYDATLGKATDRHVLGLYASGTAVADYTPVPGNEAIRLAVLARLDEMFNGEASRQYINSVVQNWTAEPFIRGTYSRHSAKLVNHLRQVDEKLFFAGEAINKQSRTIAVHGAGESAYLAVKAALASGFEESFT